MDRILMMDKELGQIPKLLEKFNALAKSLDEEPYIANPDLDYILFEEGISEFAKWVIISALIKQNWQTRSQIIKKLSSVKMSTKMAFAKYMYENLLSYLHDNKDNNDKVIPEKILMNIIESYEPEVYGHPGNSRTLLGDYGNLIYAYKMNPTDKQILQAIELLLKRDKRSNSRR